AARVESRPRDVSRDKQVDALRRERRPCVLEGAVVAAPVAEAGKDEQRVTRGAWRRQRRSDRGAGAANERDDTDEKGKTRPHGSCGYMRRTAPDWLTAPGGP